MATGEKARPVTAAFAKAGAAAPGEPEYELEFYEDEHGYSPVATWLKNLPQDTKHAVGRAMQFVLQRHGIDVCNTRYGKQLKDGLFEFRLDDTINEIRHMSGQPPLSKGGDEKLLVRIFCHAHGKKLILLLGGYDKLQHPSKPYQNQQIELAKARLTDWRESEKNKKKALAKGRD